MKKISIFIIAFIILISNCMLCSAADNSYYTIDQKNQRYTQFSEGLCGVLDQETQRWGFIDKSGEWHITPQFKEVREFNDGLCNVTTVDGEFVFINRNGEIVRSADSSTSQYIKLLNGCGYITAWNYEAGRIIDSNYNDIAEVKPINQNTYTFFKTEANQIYNSKGENITNKLDIDSPHNCSVNNKYLVYHDEENVYVYNFEGNLISSFPHKDSKRTGNITLFSENIKISNDDNLYNINGDVVLSTTANIQEYYNKYFVLSKKNGTSALFKKDGTQIVEFGKWDTIVPASTTDKMLVSVNQKFGISDFNNNLIIPLEFLIGKVCENGKTATLGVGNSDIILYDFFTSQQKNAKRETLTNYGDLIYGGGRIYAVVAGESPRQVLDENLNTIKGTDEFFYFYSNTGINEGVWSFSDHFLIFNDGGGIKVTLDRTELIFDTPPVIREGRTLVPLRAIFEALGAIVEWDEKTQTVTAQKDDVVIQMKIGNNTITKNGEISQIDVCPQLIDNRTMVPVRAISDSFNVLVDWNGYTQTVSLFTI